MLSNKKLKQNWLEKIGRLVKELPATDVTPEVQSDYAEVWNIETKVGILQITLFKDLNLIQDLSLFARWLNVKQALSAGIKCNPCNGKWNFHFSSNVKTRAEKIAAMDSAIYQVKVAIENYL